MTNLVVTTVPEFGPLCGRGNACDPVAIGILMSLPQPENEEPDLM